MFKKFAFAALAVLICGTVFAAPKARKKKRLAPGASCYVWNENVKNKPDSIPAGGFVDEAVAFHWHNIRACDELKQIGTHSFILWQGYLRVNKTGQYRFTLSMNEWTARDSTVKVFLNKQPLIVKQVRGAQTLSGQANIKRGFVPIVIYFNPIFNNANFSLKYAPVNSMKMTNIIPATMYHAVEEEE